MHTATSDQPMRIGFRSAHILSFWLVAALLVFSGHELIARWSRDFGEAIAMASVILVAWAYARTTRSLGVTHALAVGIVWVALAVLVEIAIGTHIGRGWYSLLGRPDRPLLRNVMLFIWVFAPVMFAQGEDEA